MGKLRFHFLIKIIMPGGADLVILEDAQADGTNVTWNDHAVLMDQKNRGVKMFKEFSCFILSASFPGQPN